jgi:hypothetical protein
MSHASPLWGDARIHGKLLKLGIDIRRTSVAKYMARPRRRRDGRPNAAARDVTTPTGLLTGDGVVEGFDADARTVSTKN